MEAALLDKIKKAANKKLANLQKKHKLDIGTLPYKHGHQLDMNLSFGKEFSNIAQENYGQVRL